MSALKTTSEFHLFPKLMGCTWQNQQKEIVIAVVVMKVDRGCIHSVRQSVVFSICTFQFSPNFSAGQVYSPGGTMGDEKGQSLCS